MHISVTKRPTSPKNISDKSDNHKKTLVIAIFPYP